MTTLLAELTPRIRKEQYNKRRWIVKQMMESSTPVCPVPEEQQPLNEYQQLRESWFYCLPLQDWSKYIRAWIILWALSWTIVGPVTAASFPIAKLPIQFLLTAAAGACLVPLFVLIRLYLGWNYIRDRLQKSAIVYEESGWYDGQVWTKPETVVQRDRLLVSYEVMPILRRLQQTFGVFALLLFFNAAVWIFL